jgi:hypothetical protein
MLVRRTSATWWFRLWFLAQGLIIWQPYQSMGIFQSGKCTPKVLISIAAVCCDNFRTLVACRQILDLLSCDFGISCLGADALNIFGHNPGCAPLHQTNQPGVFVSLAHRFFLLCFEYTMIGKRLCCHAFVGRGVDRMDLISGNRFPTCVLTVAQ